MITRIAQVSLHPVPYHAALYRALERDPRIESEVLFLSRLGTRPRFEAEWNARLEGDTKELLEGYRHRFLANWSWNEFAPPISRINPGLIPALLGRRRDAVLIMGYDSLSALLALALAKLRGSKALLRAEADLTQQSAGWRSRLKARLLPWILRRYDAVLYGCRANRAYFRHFGVAEEKLFFLPSTVDNARLLREAEDRAETRAAQRAALGIPSEATVVAFFGRLIPRKRPGDLLAAFKRIAGDFPEAWLLLVGEGQDRAALETAAAGETRIIFAGFRQPVEVPAVLMASDLLALPSDYDPTPKILHEAMILGLPCLVSSGVGTAGDLVVDGENGAVFPSGDGAALAAGLRSLLENPERRRAFGAAARSTAEAWSPEAGVEGIVAALDFCRGRRG
ncbi:MAG: glycosyltransferase family 4 protein [Rhodovibrionaceae bacterium]